MKAPPSVLAIETTENAKLGACSCTYVSQESCPADCPFMGAGCYAELGHTGIVTRRLNDTPERRADRLAAEEGRAIDTLTGDSPLRLHVVGDCRTERAARSVAAAARRFLRRGGQPVWTYTHSWRRVPRAAWGDVSVLASCESVEHVAEARALGYAAALVVAEFEQAAAYEHHGERVIPCPHQTRGVQCVDCRLCFDDGRLLNARLTIAFEAHGASRRRVALTVLSHEKSY